MSLGPIDLVVLKFPGNKFKGEIAPALADLVEKGTIRIIDLLFAIKDADGKVGVLELGEMGEGVAVLEPGHTELAGTLHEDDARSLAGDLENESSALILLFENVWARTVADAMRNAGGELVLAERIPRTVIEELVKTASGSQATPTPA